MTTITPQVFGKTLLVALPPDTCFGILATAILLDALDSGDVGIAIVPEHAAPRIQAELELMWSATANYGALKALTILREPESEGWVRVVLEAEA